MTRYIAIVESSRKNRYGAWIADAPGCVATGSTLDELSQNAADALKLWVEDAVDAGETLPRSRSLDEIKTLPDVQESLSRGAVLIAIPLLLETGRPARANISLDAGLLQSIDEFAKARGLTRSAFLASAAREKIIAET
jgi:predicted RNase H-like HicB family nuclease